MGVLSGSELETELNVVQHRLYDGKKAVMTVFEGAGGSMMSFLINGFISMLEPRGVDYRHIDAKGLSDYIAYAPANGRIRVFDRAWYSDIIQNNDITEDAVDEIVSLERYLTDNGVILVKIFLDIDGKKISKFKDTYPVLPSKECGFLGDSDPDYERFSLKDRKTSELIERTDTHNAPWHIIEAGDYEKTLEAVGNAVLKHAEHYTQYSHNPSSPGILPVYPNPRENNDFSLSLSKSDYKKKLNKYQDKLSELQCRLALSDKSLVLAFEGWDAAGKGGSIKRVTGALNPRGYSVYPTPAPTAEEKANTYLWRFAKNIPEKGHIAIFDRSWYGRMMVEPIEGFCTEEEYSRSAEEINMFEKMLSERKCIVIKFWMDITKDVQLERFNDRMNDPMKRWKITDEDWRNREKWDTYEDYVNEMIEHTNSPDAPWYSVESTDKYYGRIKVLKTICDTLEKEL